MASFMIFFASSDFMVFSSLLKICAPFRQEKLIGIGWLPELRLKELVCLCPDRMREERQRYLRRATLFALPTVDTGVGDVREAAQVEHWVGRDETGADHLVRLFPLVCNSDADRAVVDAGVTLHATSRLLGNGLPEGGGEGVKIFLPPLVAELVHRIFYLGPELNALEICRFGGEFVGFDGRIEKFSTL